MRYRVDSSARLGFAAALSLVVPMVAVTPAWAIEFSGVQDAALDQPQVNAIIYYPNDSNADNLLVQDNPDLGGIFDDVPGLSGTTANISAYFDTGADVGLIAESVAGALHNNTVTGLPEQTGAEFQDVGVGGTQAFNISQSVTVKIASNTLDIDLSTPPINYNQTYDNVYLSVGKPVKEQSDPIDTIIAQLSEFNVLGMPFFKNKTVVMDVRSLNNFAKTGEIDLDNIPMLYTHVYKSDGSDAPAWNPTNTENPGIPTADAIDLTIPLKFADFTSLTTTTGGTAPTLAHNPMIGGNVPGSFGENDGRNPQGITITHGASSSQGTWLFDTGAAASMISTDQAAAVGVAYSSDDGKGFGDADPTLVDTATGDVIPNQFTLQLQGVGGTVTVAGFYLDSLTIPTASGENLTFTDAPVLVDNIEITDPNSDPSNPTTYTLDGVFGMNFLLASAYVNGQADPNTLATVPGAFDFVVYDEATNTLKLVYDPSVIPEPGTAAAMAVGGAMLMLKRKRNR